MNQQVRQQRVANGSRRKRDLEAVEPKPDFASIVQQLPDELPHRVRTAAMRLCRAKRRTMPTPEEVWMELEATGMTKAQIEAKYGVGVQ